MDSGFARRRAPRNDGAYRPASGSADGLAIDRRPVPLAHRFEIRSALAARRGGFPARGSQQIGGAGEHIRPRTTSLPHEAVEIAAEVQIVAYRTTIEKTFTIFGCRVK
jgi:hypothetical protein